MRPRSIAVVGASSDPGTVAGLLFENLMGSQFSGTVMPVNRRHPAVQGIAAYPDLASCPTVPDLVVVCVPAAAAVEVIRQAGDLGVKAACIISAGYAETGADGAMRQTELAHVAAAGGVRLVGPNCTGVLNGTDGARFNATFSRAFPPGPDVTAQPVGSDRARRPRGRRGPRPRDRRLRVRGQQRRRRLRRAAQLLG